MGIIQSLYTQTFPPAAKWGVEDIPDLTGHVAVVTGGYAGIGTYTVKALLSHNACVYVAGRDETETTKTIDTLKTETGKDAFFLKLDLSDLKSVKAAAEELASKEQAIHILFNNAGVMSNSITADGYDLQWGTNVLGHFYFSALLVPLLREGAQLSPDGKARVVHTASSAAVGGQVNFATFRDGLPRQKLGKYMLYCQSKLGNILISNAMARKYASDGIISVAVNPGTVKSELQRHTGSVLAFIIDQITYPTHLGALTQLWAGTSHAGLSFNGKYLWPWAREGQMIGHAADENLQEDVWKWCEEQTKDI